MNNINSYFVSEENDKIKLLLEILDNQYNSLSSFYYELVIKTNNGKLDKEYYKLESINEIYDILVYLYKNFNGNIKKRKLDSKTTDYVLKMLNDETKDIDTDRNVVNRIKSYGNKEKNK